MKDDYIRKSDAVNALKAQADTMRTWVERYAEQRRGILTAVNIVEDIKPADVASVVRCKDCKYNATTHKCLNPDSFFLIPKDDDFCSYGERRGEQDGKEIYY